MLEDYGSPTTSFTERVKRVFIFVSVVIILILGVFLLLYLGQLPSPEQKRKLQELAEKEKALMESIQTLVLDAGYQKRTIGYRELYVPVIILEISNVSLNTVQDIFVSSDFRNKRQTICTGTGMFFKLNPGDRRALILRCSESMFLGTLIKGLNLSQARKDLGYKIRISSEGIYFYSTEGMLRYKVLPSRLPQY
jgi:hypothetical protein